MSQIPCRTLLACYKKISPEENKIVTRVSEGQKDPRNLQFTTYCDCLRMSALDLGTIHPETILNLLYAIHYFW